MAKFSIKLFIGIVVLLMAGGGLLSTPSHAANDPLPLMAFNAKVGDKYQVYTVRADGSELQVLTTTASFRATDWSPDGKMLVGVAMVNAVNRLATLDLQGQLTVLEPDIMIPFGLITLRYPKMHLMPVPPQWSPDGRFILFLGYNEAASCKTTLYAHALEADAQNPLVAAEICDLKSVLQAQWLPDSHSYLVFGSGYKGNASPFMQVLHSQFPPIASEEITYLDGVITARLAPDGERLAVITNFDTTTQTSPQLALMTLTSSEKSVFNIEGNNAGHQVVWSPDSQHIVFWTVERTTTPNNLEPPQMPSDEFEAPQPLPSKITITRWYLNVVNVDGCGQQRLGEGYIHIGVPSWSPTSDYIAHYGRLSRGKGGIYLLIINTQDGTQITVDSAEFIPTQDSPLWQPTLSQ